MKNLKKTVKLFAFAILALIMVLNTNINHCDIVYAQEKPKNVKNNETAIQYGDVNADGAVDIGDGVAMKKYLAQMNVTIDQVASDVNVDGDINTQDAVLLMKHLAGMNVEFGGLQPSQQKTLIVYFTWSSNTQRMANTIKEQTGGDILEIVPVHAYPADYTTCTEVALEERDNNARPAIQNLPDSIEEYDNILIGYPIWWHTAPMIIGTFLEHYDLTGVNIYPFTQSASMNTEQFDNSMAFVRECAKNAIVHDGLFARATNENAIISYLNDNNLIREEKK